MGFLPEHTEDELFGVIPSARHGLSGGGGRKQLADHPLLLLLCRGGSGGGGVECRCVLFVLPVGRLLAIRLPAATSGDI